MTIYYAVIEDEKIKQGDEYVRYGTARQMQAYVAATQGDVTLYRVKNAPEFVKEEDLNPVKALDVKGTIDDAKTRVEQTIAELGLPKSKEEGIALLKELQGQAINEAREAGIVIATTLAMAYQLGNKDPKQLAEIAKSQGLAKVEEVKGRALGFFGKLTAAAKGLQDEFTQTAKGKVEQAKSEITKPAPDGVVAGDEKFVRAAWLLSGDNAVRVSQSQLLKDAAPKAKKTQQPK